MQDKKVYVILVSYGHAEETLACVNSLLAADGAELHIVIVDNCSPDDTYAVLKSKLPEEITLLAAERNGGFSAGNNLGIRYALDHGADYIMLLNNDTVIDPHMLRELLANCDDGQISVPCMYEYDRPRTIWYAGGGINRCKGSARHFHQGRTDQALHGAYCDFATGCCMMLSAAAVKKAGYLDEAFFLYCEDLDYSIRLKKQGIKIRFVPSAKLWHKVGSSSGGEGAPTGAYYGSRNRLYVIDRHPEEFYPTAKPYTVLTRLAHALLARIRGQKAWKWYIAALRDHRSGVTGRVEIDA